MICKTETGKRIAALRNKLGYSQSIFAEKLNVSAQAVSKWETGLALPDIDILLNISWMCRVTINEILDHDEIFIDQLNCISREMLRMNKILVCPQCRKPLQLKLQTNQNMQYYECDDRHVFHVEEGVIYFNTREIPCELWSLWLRNYDHYLLEQNHPGNPRYMQGEISCPEVMWRKIDQIRPTTIVDFACGTGSGIKYVMERINWPCTVIMADLSYRILSWNRRFFYEEKRNPYVDMVFLACDCANIPLADHSVDMVFSASGFESMQDKMMSGFCEAYRILKSGGHAVYNMSLVNSHDSVNTKKWIELYMSLDASYHSDMGLMQDCSQWMEKCMQTGFVKNDATRIYDELPAPDDTVFPFENEVLQWMGLSVFVSQK